MACRGRVTFRAGRDDDENRRGGERVGEFCFVAVLIFPARREGERVSRGLSRW